jgi:hypothetical protein
MPTKQQLQEHYQRLSNDDLARIALTAELTPEAREIISQELHTRGLTDLSSFKRQMEEDAVVTNPARYNQVSLDMELRLKRSIAVGGLVATAWVGAALLPIAILGSDRPESIGTRLQVLGILGALLALSLFLGLRARRQGRRLAFYLRAVIPVALLCASMAIVLAARWAAR